jgi:hypothetical protein
MNACYVPLSPKASSTEKSADKPNKALRGKYYKTFCAFLSLFWTDDKLISSPEGETASKTQPTLPDRGL